MPLQIVPSLFAFRVVMEPKESKQQEHTNTQHRNTSPPYKRVSPRNFRQLEDQTMH